MNLQGLYYLRARGNRQRGENATGQKIVPKAKYMSFEVKKKREMFM